MRRMFPGKCAKNLTFFSQTTQKMNNNFKQNILQNVQMDTQTSFMANGDINIYPCSWEDSKAPVTADGKGLVRYRGGIEVDVQLVTNLPDYEDPGHTYNSETIQKLEQQVARAQELMDSSMTRQELDVAIGTKYKEIGQLETSLKVAKLDLEKKKSELGDGNVYAEFDRDKKEMRLYVRKDAWDDAYFFRENRKTSPPPRRFIALIVPP